MDSNSKDYDHLASFKRIDDILAQPQGNYEEVKELPDRDRLTFTNGFYASCSALFTDIRNSSNLPDIYNRPALAKLYRAYISELVAIYNGVPKAREINITGDCVWGVFNTPYKDDIDAVFSAAAEVSSLVDVLNCKLSHANYKTPIEVGIGIEYGRTLMIKAGHSGSGINDVVYMGEVVNRAAKLASEGSKGLNPEMMVGSTFYSNLNADNQSLLRPGPAGSDRYQGNVVNTRINEWHKANC